MLSMLLLVMVCDIDSLFVSILVWITSVFSTALQLHQPHPAPRTSPPHDSNPPGSAASSPHRTGRAPRPRRAPRRPANGAGDGVGKGPGEGPDQGPGEGCAQRGAGAEDGAESAGAAEVGENGNRSGIKHAETPRLLLPLSFLIFLLLITRSET